jgi:hypothetical protein
MADAAKDDTGMRKAIFLPRSVWNRIADFRFAHRYKTEAEAVRQLLLDGLKANERTTSTAAARPVGRTSRRRG